MSKRLLFVAALFLYSFLPVGKAGAQVDPNLFKLPDTVCNGHEIVPFDVIETAQNYFWSFCPPNLGARPDGQNIGTLQGMDNVNGIVVAEDDGLHFSFHINKNRGVGRMRYENGLNSVPTIITGIGNNVTNPGGLALANDGLWHLFVVSGTDASNSKLMRYDFNDQGLKSMPTEVLVGNLGKLNGPKQLMIAKQGNDWVGFTFTHKDELVRLEFGANLSSQPNVVVLGNIDGHFENVSGMSAIKELDNWHIFITNRTKNSVNRISFGNSLYNIPFVNDLGDVSRRIIEPVGITVTKDCDAYYAYVLNYGTASLIMLRWDDQSIANVPQVTNFGNTSNFKQAKTLSNIVRTDGAFCMLAGNTLDNSVSNVIFNSCNNATPAYSNLRQPQGFIIDEPGLYTVFLTVDQGLPSVKTDCKQVYVYDHPALTISNDTLICQGDSIRLVALSFGVDSFKWTPNYNMDTARGQFVVVYPQISTRYYLTSYYKYNCIVKKPIDVNVSKIKADAGPDRIISDGAATVLGGPNTTVGPNYEYLWTPDIGYDFSRTTPTTRVVPPYSMTYYLNVSNSDGCKTIDSVHVTVPCDDINLPNAFKPSSEFEKVNKFGILNLQFGQINYFRIFDRWGKMVFSTTNVRDRWDGNIDGQPAPLGVYVWEIDAICGNTQDRFRKTGSVTLIR